MLASLVGLSIEGLTSFSVAPLRLASLLGLVLAVIALLFGASILWETTFRGKSVPGYPSLVVTSTRPTVEPSTAACAASVASNG